MDVSRQAEAVMLLTVSFGKSDADTTRPLTPTEWGAFASWLKDNALAPDDLLKPDLSGLLETWEHPKVTLERVQALLNRGAALGFALEKWQRAGLWVLTRSDPDYPRLLKKRLGRRRRRSCSAAATGTCSTGTVSRWSAPDTLATPTSTSPSGWAKGPPAAEGWSSPAVRRAWIRRRCWARSMPKARPLASWRTAFSAPRRRQGTASTSCPGIWLWSRRSTRRHASWSAMPWRATSTSIAWHSTPSSSAAHPTAAARGAGAVENLRQGWVPLWVKETDAPDSGNPRLVEQGGRWLADVDDLVFATAGDDVGPEPAPDPSDHAPRVSSGGRQMVLEGTGADEMAGSLEPEASVPAEVNTRKRGRPAGGPTGRRGPCRRTVPTGSDAGSRPLRGTEGSQGDRGSLGCDHADCQRLDRTAC